MRLPLSLLILLPSICFAETKAVINGPTQIEFGSLLVLSASESVGDNHDWIVDSKFTTPVRIDKLTKELWSGLPGPGVYEFTLIVADKQANIAYDKHTVEVTLPSWLKPPQPPIQPPPPTPGKISEEVGRLTKLLNDKDTTSKLIYQLDVVANGEVTQEAIQKAVSTALLNRTGQSATKDWLGGWRTPVDKLINEEVKKGISLKTCLDQILAGLRSVTFNSVVPKIIVTTLPNCPPCLRFKNETYPKLKDEFDISFIEVNPANFTDSAPRIEIQHNGKTIIHQGFITAESLRSLIK
jgi:hypothetical protein